MTLLSESSGAKESSENDRQPENIALAIFRFKARRGIGVYYTLLALVPLLVAVLETISAPSYFTLFSVGLLILGILYLARSAGMKRFYQMKLVMNFFEQSKKDENRGLRLETVISSARTVLVTLLPLLASAIFVMTGSAVLGSAVLIGYAIFVSAYYVFVFSKLAPDSVLPWRVEDWLVVVFPTALLFLSFFQVIDTTTYLVSLLVLLLLAGLKSSYEAPQALVDVMSDNDIFSKASPPPSRKQGDINLSELTSGGALSNFAKAGIMLALLGVEQITFTDLMLALKISKSSLNHSVNALADVGYVTVSKGFKTAGGPRTFIEITSKGEEAIRSHLENMKMLASKFLS